MTAEEHIAAWQAKGKTHRLAGLDVFAIDTDPDGGTHAILVLHGFPSSSHDWHKVLPALIELRRVILLDFVGFGLSAKPERFSYSLLEQCDLVLMLLRELGVQTVDVLAHDMGTSVATEMLARRGRGLLPIELRSVLLTNGSPFIELARLTPAQKLLLSRIGPAFARVSSRFVFMAQLKRILALPVDAIELEAMYQQLIRDDGKLRLPQSIGYVRERHRFHARWIGALEALTDLPVHVLWGDRDPVAVPIIGQRLHEVTRGSTHRTLPGVGHYPMLEAPEVFTASVREWLDSLG